MQINILSLNNVNNYRDKSISYNTRVTKFAPLEHDTVNFRAMKKSQFAGINHAIVEKFKAPIEKFNTQSDFQNWASNAAKNIMSKNYGGRQAETVAQRKHMLKEWSDYVFNENTAYTGAIGLLILNAITKNLKPDNDKIPPVLNKGVLADCISEIDRNASSDNQYQFDLRKMYETKLGALYLENGNVSTDKTGWVVIPSKSNDPEHFEENVEKLKALSHKNWCTKSFNAEPYLSDGDFHVYLENGHPKLGVRFIGEQIEEIQGEENNGKVPLSYYEEVKNHINDNRLKFTDGVQKQLDKAKEKKIHIDETRQILKTAIETNDAKRIFEYFGIKTDIDKDGFLTISEYCQPTRLYGLSFSDYGIDENKLLEKVKHIIGDANFTKSTATSVPNLETIGKAVIFEASQITDLPRLRCINGSAYFQGSQVVNLPSLISIGGSAFFRNSCVKNLSKLEHIGELADFTSSQVTDLPNLRSICGIAIFNQSKISNLPCLQHIGGGVDLRNSQITILPSLQTIAGDVYLSASSQIIDSDKVKIHGVITRW